jgi:hypothetical protein
MRSICTIGVSGKREARIPGVTRRYRVKSNESTCGPAFTNLHGKGRLQKSANGLMGSVVTRNEGGPGRGSKIWILLTQAEFTTL